MKRIPTTFIISTGLASLTLALVLAGSSLGLVPDGRAGVRRERARFAELFAATCVPAVVAADHAALDQLVRQVAAGDGALLRATVRDARDGILAAYDRRGDIRDPCPAVDVLTVAIPGDEGRKDAGRIDLEFAADGDAGAAAGWASWGSTTPLLRLTVFVTGAGFVAYALYLRLVLRHLDPSAVIPPRVRAMLDVMSEGIVILDRGGRIVLANASFCRSFGLAVDRVTGREVDGLGWAHADGRDHGSGLPWRDVLNRGGTVHGAALSLPGGAVGPDYRRTFAVNATPIRGPGGRVRGVVASFNDVTEIERANELLRQSNAEVERANAELLRLATTDPLTGCLNRRAFFARVDTVVARASADGSPFAVVMLDIDHFKGINDRFGHATGDRVLKGVADVLTGCGREGDLLCRYGGEEFCVLLSDVTAAGAERAAERFRAAVEAGPWDTVAVTASVGLCASEQTPSIPMLLNRADEALYTSKRTGRNRTTCWRDPSGDPASEGDPRPVAA